MSEANQAKAGETGGAAVGYFRASYVKGPHQT